MRIDLIAIGTHGDVLPFIALGDELCRRGHQVGLAAPAPFRVMAERVGLDFSALGTADDYRTQIAANDLWHPLRGARPLLYIVAQAIEPIHAWLAERWKPWDRSGVVVASTLALGARVAEEHLAIKLITVHLMPMIMESRIVSPWLPGMPHVLSASILRHKYSRGADQYVIDPAILPPLNAYRASVGLDIPVKRLRWWWNLASELILMFPAWYAPPQLDWPANAVQVGFPMADCYGDENDLDLDLEAFIEAGTPPLVFTHGSAMAASEAFFRTAVAICEQMGRRGVLLAPNCVPGGLPASVVHRHYAPLSRLLPHSAALIHHGGVGTVAQALAAGVPQLVVPVAFDHFDEAQRLCRLNLGTSLSRRRFTPARAARVLRRLLSSRRVASACEAARQHVKRQDGVAAACDVIEKVARRA